MGVSSEQRYESVVISKVHLAFANMQSVRVLLLLGMVGLGTAQFIGEVFGTTSYEGAPYEVVRTMADGVEERPYPAKKWACKSSQGDESRSSFMTLFNYIEGANQQEEKIKMTVPVTTEADRDGTMTMCFYLGEKHQASPPTPTGGGVFIENRPALSVFTRRFGGWASESDWSSEKNAVKAVVENEGIAFDKTREYRVSYQSPMRLFNRRN